MATQHDYDIANGTGQAVRQDINSVLQAIVSNNSGTSEPATTFKYQWWADETNNVLKIRNSANNAWITLRELDGTLLMEDGSNSAPGLSFASDTNTGFFSGGADKIGFATGGVERLEIGSSEVVFNDPSNDVDFRVESNGNTHMLFVDAGNDRVGIGTTPDGTLHVHSGTAGTVTANGNADDLVVESSGTGGISILTPDASTGYLIFGSPTSDEGAILRYSDSNNVFTIGTEDANGLLQFRTGAGTEAARIDSSGRMGIGLSSNITSLLHVESSFAGTLAEIKNTRGSASTDNGLLVETSTTAAKTLLVQNAGTERFSVKGDGTGYLNGSLGIGTSSPGTVLDVEGSGVPVEINSTNSNSNKLKLTDNGTVRGYVGASSTASFLVSGDGGSEQLRMDSSGRLLIGTTSGLLSGDEKKLQMLHANAGAEIVLGRNDSSVTDGNSLGAFKFVGNDDSGYQLCAKIEAIADGTHADNDKPTRLVFSTTASGANTPTERMRIGNDGVVKISKANAGNIFRIESTGANEASMLFQNTTTGTGPGNGLYVGAGGSTTHGYLWNYENNALVFGTNNTERMRVTDAGQLAIGGTSTVASAKIGITFPGNTSNGIGLQTTFSGTGTDFIRFNNSAGNQCGEIQQTGTTATSYITSSDYRLKENVGSLNDGIERVKRLIPYRFSWIADDLDAADQDGFFAHEVQEVVPIAVGKTQKDAVDDDGNPVYQGIDHSKLVPLLTAALQEAIAKIETLETKVAALEAD